MREEAREIKEVEKEKNLLRKYFFNRWALIDFRTALIREITKLVVTIYILNKFLAKQQGIKKRVDRQ